MSKGLRNIEDLLERENVVQRRLREKKGGLGYWAAVDLAVAIGLHRKGELFKEKED